MAKTAGAQVLWRIFSTRIGRKAFLFALPLAFMMLLIPKLSIFGAVLFSGTIASRLNDVGWSRWHSVWLTAWSVLAVIVARAHPVAGIALAQHRAALGTIELPLFILLLGLGLFPSQDQVNRFGPVPLSFREYWHMHRDRRTYRKAYRKLGPQLKQLAAEQKMLSGRVQELNKRMRELRAAGNPFAADGMKKEFDEAVMASKESFDRFELVHSRLEPARKQFEKSRSRMTEIFRFKLD